MRGRLGLADYATLAGLGLGWAATSLLLVGRPGTATFALLVAFLCDKADGCLARRGHGSSLGAHLDALADVVIYLVPTAVLLAESLSVSPALAFAAGTAVLGFGVVRLARFAADGTGTDGGCACYRGLTAFHVAAWALVVRLAVSLTALPGTVGAVAVGAAAPLMIAPIRIRVTRRQLIGAVAVGLFIAVGTVLDRVPVA